MCLLLLTTLSPSSYLMLKETLRYSHFSLSFITWADRRCREVKQHVTVTQLVTAGARASVVCAPNHCAAVLLISVSSETAGTVSTEGLGREESCVQDAAQCHVGKLTWSSSWECSKLKTEPHAAFECNDIQGSES